MALRNVTAKQFEPVFLMNLHDLTLIVFEKKPFFAKFELKISCGLSASTAYRSMFTVLKNTNFTSNN